MGLGVLLLAAAGQLAGGLPSEREQQAVAAAECAEPSIRNVFPIPEAGLNVGTVFWNTRIAVGRSKLVVVGNAPTSPSQAKSAAHAAPFRGVVIESPRGTVRELPPPSASRYLDHPVPAVDDRGVIHLVWADVSKAAADSVPPDGSRSPPAKVDAVWYAQFREGRWSRPELVVSDVPLFWNDEVSHITITPTGLLLAFAGTVPGSLPSIYVAYRSGLGARGSWRVAHASHEYVTVYADAVAMPNGRWVVGYAGPNRAVRGEGQAMYTTATTDGGATWRPPLLVRGGDRHPSLKVRLVRSRSAIHMLWAQSTSEDLRPEAVEHAESRDGGATWTRLTPMPRQGVHIHELHAAVDACDRLHVVLNVSDQSGERYSLASAWSGGAWTALDTLAGDRLHRAYAVHVATGPFSRALVVTTVQPSSAGPDSARTILLPLPGVKRSR